MRPVRFALYSWITVTAAAVERGRAQQPPLASGAFINFESTQVRPLALTSDGQTLFVCNTPDNRVARIDTATMTVVSEVSVGLDPVALAIHPVDGRIWTANLLSDTISVVDFVAGHVVKTIQVGDEPSDIVFHPSGSHAFVTLAQERALAVIDTSTYAVTKLAVDGDDPRAMTLDASAPGGPVLYVCAFHSGNNTTIVPPDDVLPADQQQPGDYEHYDPMDPLTIPPIVARIIRDTNPNYTVSSDLMNPSLPFDTVDHDVMAYDVSNPGAGVTLTTTFEDIGTLLNGVSVIALSHQIFVTNTDARNFVRYEPNLRGHLVDHQVTVIDPVGVTRVKHNLHAELPTFDDVSAPNPAAQAISLAEPMAILTNSAGTRAYITALGVDRVGVLDVTAGGTDFSVMARIDVGRGPTGLALDEAGGRLYCINRFDQTLTVIDVSGDANTVLQTVPLGYSPEPLIVKNGRRFLYTSKQANNWGSACGTCHAGGDTDRLVWDLGDPGGFLANPPPPNTSGLVFHPMKGPMRTQSLRGLSLHQPYHFRGDRATLSAFNGAFASLIGGSTLPDMGLFTAFMNSIRYPPNPNRNIDNTYTDPLGGTGEFQWRNGTSAGAFVCNACHVIASDGTTNQLFDQQMSTGEPQLMKVPQLRNLLDLVPFQYSGFGLRHNGIDVTMRVNLEQPGFPVFTEAEKDAFVAFMKAFPTNVRPAVGHQLTVDMSNAEEPGVVNTLYTMLSQAGTVPAGCDLVAKGLYLNQRRGFVLTNPGAAVFQSDRAGQTVTLTDLTMAAHNGQAVLTFTAVPPGSGARIGINRDEDAVYDQTEIDKGSDPANPASVPGPYGDADHDGDFDLADLSRLVDCYTDEVGALYPYPPGCGLFDFDYDGDVGLTDYASFNAVFTGPTP